MGKEVARPCLANAYPAVTLDSDPRKAMITSARSRGASFAIVSKKEPHSAARKLPITPKDKRINCNNLRVGLLFFRDHPFFFRFE